MRLLRKNSKVIITVILVLVIVLGTISGALLKDKSQIKPLTGNEEILELESRKSFDFFWLEANIDKKSPGYGLIRDRAPGGSDIASIASVGYGLSALTIGVERQWVTREEGYERALGTLNTLLNNAQQEKGFFYHFINMNTGKREWNSEVSVIDTAIAICGAINAGEYFGGEVKVKAEEVYKRVDWTWYRNPKTNQFYMGYTPERGFFGAWDMTAEQFMMYFLGAGSPTHPVPGDMFYAFSRPSKSYGFYPAYISSPAGSIFTYQFSHAWFDLRNKVDKNGVNWWGNSVLASLASRQYSIDNSSYYKTFGENSWGVTASDGPKGYSGAYGMNSSENDGTIPPCGAAGSIVFTPKESIDALNYYYKNHEKLWGKYGFKDAYNIDVSPAWYDTDYIGIDKGITLLMIENYRTGLIWKYTMKNKYVQEGMKKAGLIQAGGSDSKPSAQNVIITGTPPIVGQILTARYDFYSPKDLKEGNSEYKWLIASSRDGEYKDIPGETAVTYKIKKEDAGKYIKFQVTPKAKSVVSFLGSKGEPVLSESLGEISLEDPRKFKKKQVDQQENTAGNTTLSETRVIDNFDGNNLTSDWSDGGDGVYKLEVMNGDAENKTKALKVEFNKGNAEWAFFNGRFDSKQDFSSYAELQLKAKGSTSFILKFEDSAGQGIAEKKFYINDENKWQDYNWAFMGTEEKLKNVKRILIFAAPGEKSKSGKFYLDDIKLVK